MGLTRILDLIVIILLATIILMPRPDASVKPALTIDPERRERVAELQSILIGRPDDVDASLELANIELKNRHYAKSVEYLQKALSIEKTDAVEDFLARVKTMVVRES